MCGDYTERVPDALRVAFSGLWDTRAHIKTKHELTQDQAIEFRARETVNFFDSDKRKHLTYRKG